MTPDRWQLVKAVLVDALERQGESRARFLQEACLNDPALKREVEVLLASEESAKEFLETPPSLMPFPADVPVTESLAESDAWTIGPYRVERRLGHGGMGEVLLARDLRLNRLVAIKVVTEGLAREPRFAKHLLREARAIARLSHPNIAVVYDVIESNGRIQIVMEHLRGEALANRLMRGPLATHEVRELGAQMAAGLAHAHAHGILHCDFKPANVFVTDDGVAKVLDFGLARQIKRHPDDTSYQLGASPSLRAAGAGTPGYMSPEQCRSEPLDERSDVYSLGIVLHEMATGVKPPTATTPRRGGLTPDSQRVDPSLPRALRPIVAKALAPAPCDRFQSAREIEVALRGNRWGLNLGRLSGRRQAIALVALFSVTAVGLMTAIDRWIEPLSTARSGASVPILAVLPFSSTGLEASTHYLTSVMVELLTRDLASAPRLVVVSSDSVRARGTKDRPLREITRELGATHLVLGDVTPQQGGFRLTLKVFVAKSHSVVSVGDVDASFPDLVGSQRRLRELVRLRLRRAELPIDVVPVELPIDPSDPAALEYYAQGREFLLRSEVPGNVDRAIRLFERAMEREPNFALAHASLGEAHWRKYQLTKDTSWASKAQAAAFEAMRLAPQAALVRYTAAMVLHGTGKPKEAIDEATRAISIQPNNDDPHRLLGRIYSEMGELDKAVQEFELAIAIRPASENYHAKGVAYFDHNQFALARQAFERETELRPDSAGAFQALVSCL